MKESLIYESPCKKCKKNKNCTMGLVVSVGSGKGACKEFDFWFKDSWKRLQEAFGVRKKEKKGRK